MVQPDLHPIQTEQSVNSWYAILLQLHGRGLAMMQSSCVSNTVPSAQLLPAPSCLRQSWCIYSLLDWNNSWASLMYGLIRYKICVHVALKPWNSRMLMEGKRKPAFSIFLTVKSKAPSWLFPDHHCGFLAACTPAICVQQLFNSMSPVMASDNRQCELPQNTTITFPSCELELFTLLLPYVQSMEVQDRFAFRFENLDISRMLLQYPGLKIVNKC